MNYLTMNRIQSLPFWLLLFSLLVAEAAPGPFHFPVGPGIAAPKILYVKEGNDGKGQSWEDAFGDLQQALKAARKGDQIWVAAGRYLPTYDNDRSIAFELVNEVSLYGGFSGTETTFAARNVALNPTILSGEIGAATLADNSYTIVYAEKISTTTIIDGFIISGGNADGMESGVWPSACGAGWFNRSASPYISNCTFQQNTAREGGAIYNYAGKDGISSPRIVNCTFIDNQAELDGGAIFNDGEEGRCMPRIENCYFENNMATYGAVMMNRARNGMTKVSVCQCKLIKNIALVAGSDIYNHRSNSGICVSTTQDCFFEDRNDASINLNMGISTDLDPRLKEPLRPLNLPVLNSWCYNHDPEFCQTQGRLYTFNAARLTCSGSAIPSLTEWLSPLSGYFDDELQQAVGDPKEAYRQIIGNVKGEAGSDHDLLGGRFVEGTFRERGLAGYFWTSTPRNDQEHYVIYFDTRDGMVHKGWANIENGLSCICFEQ